MLLTILYQIIAPIFVLVGLGFLLDRKFSLDMKTLGHLNFYVFGPALVFAKIVEAEMSMPTMGVIGGFCVLHLLIMYVVGRMVYSFHPALRGRQTMLSLGTIFYNAGNYGIPLIMLAFGESELKVIAVILVVQNFLSFTVGIALLESDRNPGKMVSSLIKIPMVQVILLAILIRAIDFDFNSIELLSKPVKFLGDGLIPVALLTLGAQLSRARPSGVKFPLAALVAMRLMVSPAIAALMLLFFDFPAPVPAILVVSAGLPVAVNVAILAGVYQKDEDLASQGVFWSTVISAITISILLLITHGS